MCFSKNNYQYMPNVIYVSISNSISHFSLKLFMNNVILEELPRKKQKPN